MRNDFLLHSNLTPFFWAKLAAPALLIGALGSGCSAGVDGAPKFNDPVAPTTQAPASSTTQNPRPAPAANPTGAAATSTQTNTSTAPASNTAGGAAANGNAGSGDAANDDEAENDENEALPTPPLDPGARPEEPGDGNANAGGGNQNVDNDDDDDEIGDDNGGDDDDDRDDDDDDDRGDDDDDDDDGGGATPTPTPPPANPAADAVTFTADIRPILLDNCGRCHASGGLPRFASNDAASSFDVAFQQRNSIVQEIQSGNMPADTCNGSPGSNGCVSVADFNLIRQWVADGAPE